ncbi:S8 family serine peptidase [Hymenobacter weizhouensis]|uniref:S8 family serine peptidase n=1 Tax=Hymenobacter sp. YIM 151500-1 TaxID=2987689 RepID=UPI002225EB92|nr:S8 family serine peptidase [Hymenobacter sp. YIM 151500-1]UYZ64107.1 S8 family serine peptidase [Hymenobacter sp. YIM 151500-1]
MHFPRLLLLASLWAPAALAAPTRPHDPPPASNRPTGTVRRHLLYFQDKANSPYSLAQPQAYLSARAVQRRQRQGIAVQPRDLPVNPGYVAQVKAVPGAELWYTSRWFNAAVVACDSATLTRLQALPCVKTVRTLNRGLPGTRKHGIAEQRPDLRRGTRPQYGAAYAQNQQVGALQMHEAGFRGEGLHIAVFDSGFPGVDQAAPFAHLRQEQRLASTFNFVDKQANVFQRDQHGTRCLSVLAADQPGLFVGTAPKASYHLFITEDTGSEHPVEEMNWLLAAERADSAGVDIISSSLGYSTFDYPSIDYTYNDLNGRTAISTRAATVAARVGMLVVNSAGNEGAHQWRYILAPADADSILTVGAVDSLSTYAGFSSRGPTADGRIKPNLAAMGAQTAVLTPDGAVVRGNGTSYACPVLAGVAAGFWQANPRLTAQQVISLLQRSGTRATAPDDEVGYGVPNFGRAYNLANPGTPLPVAGPAPRADLYIYPNPTKDNELYLQLSAPFRAQPLLVRIYDGRGSLVAEQKLAPTTASEVQLQPGILSKGAYTCIVTAGREQRTIRFLKL